MIQKILLSVVLFCAACLVGFFLLIKVVDFNEYKPRIQKAIKESTGYETVIHGDISLSLSPVGVSISDVEVTNPYEPSQTPFAKLGSFDIALDMVALVKKEIKIKHISVDNLVLSLQKNKNGQLNYLLPSTAKETLTKAPIKEEIKVEGEHFQEDELFVNVTKVKFNHASIFYQDLSENNTTLSLENIDLEMNDIRFDPTKHQLQSLSFLAKTHVDTLRYAQYVFNDISMSMEMKDAMATSENLKYTLFDTPIQGSGKFDFSGKQPKISLKHRIEGLNLNTFVKTVFNQDLLDGTADGDLKLSFFLGDAMSFKTTLNGYVHLYGKDVTFKGYNVDKLAALIDPKAPKSLDTLLSSTQALQGGKTALKELNANVEIGYSEIRLNDVAFSTEKNRIALKGAINIVDEKFVNFKAGLLNEKGCSVAEQTINGTFSKPKLNLEPSSVTTLTNIAVSFFKKGKADHNRTQETNTSDDNCTVFYDGVVAQPNLAQ